MNSFTDIQDKLDEISIGIFKLIGRLIVILICGAAFGLGHGISIYIMIELTSK